MSTIQWNELPEGERAAVETLIDANQATDKTLFDNGNSGAAKAINFGNGEVQKLTLTASAPTITVTGLVAGQHAEMTLLLAQDATGTRLLPTFSPAADYGSVGAPTLTTTANKVDVLKLVSYDGVSIDYSVVGKGF